MAWLVLASETAYTLLAGVCKEAVEPTPPETAAACGGMVDPADDADAPVAAEVAGVADVALGIMTKVKVPVIWHNLSQMS